MQRQAPTAVQERAGGAEDQRCCAQSCRCHSMEAADPLEEVCVRVEAAYQPAGVPSLQLFANLGSMFALCSK